MAELTIHELIARQHSNAKNNASTEKPVTANPAAIALRIVEECGLQGALAQSLCLNCQHRVMLTESTVDANEPKLSAILYCKELARDLRLRVTRCTSHAEA